MSRITKFSFSFPDRYTEKDFVDQLDAFKNPFVQVKDGAIHIGVYNKTFPFSKDGKQFMARVFGMNDEVTIEIVEVI